MVLLPKVHASSHLLPRITCDPQVDTSLFWPCAEGVLLSSKDPGLKDGKCMSHWLFFLRFPALHKPVASQLPHPVSPGTETTLLSWWVLQQWLKK